MLKHNKQFEILTPHGWCDFDGVNKSTHHHVYEILTTNTSFKCSENHLILTKARGWVEACFLERGVALDNGEKIIDINLIEEQIDLYDPINVSNEDRSYLADNYITHHNCEFMGSSYTLINGSKLATLPIESPIFNQNGLEIFEEPIEDHKYCITVDVSRGVHQDYSALSVIDCTSMPYNVVACYKNNAISTLEYPHLIYKIAKQFNDAYLLIEVNDLGEEVSNILWYEYEYENIYLTTRKNKKLRIPNTTYLEEAKGYPGIRTTSRVKSLGCSILKDLIEKDQLTVSSFRIIEELAVFVKKKASYAAGDPQVNDDLCTTLWLFAWLTSQEQFQEVTNTNLRKTLTQRNEEFIDNNMTPFGIYSKNTAEDTYENTLLPSSDDFNFLTEDQISLLKS